MTDPALPIAAAGAGAAVPILVLAVWLWRRNRPGRLSTPEEAAAAADAALPGFATQGAVIGADGGAALAVDAHGRVAAMRRLGKRIIVRETPWDRLRSTPAGIVVETGDRMLGTVTIAGVDALDIRRLAPADLRKTG
ncbi:MULTISPECIES: hypothetical protein [unclassified Sphingomonas]|jgi:hypothetical protein|uniref:hypothetical protein n=1 Tax=unclassified Sphingomonas TaxID=196159 RepID=UPI000E103CA8|nr:MULTISPECIES: hypothetical protein [unclassified Sphingomonas]AXJ95207.1 hypothetical protein DM480_06470 [Sphingomonas sp. FARSPH]